MYTNSFFFYKNIVAAKTVQVAIDPPSFIFIKAILRYIYIDTRNSAETIRYLFFVEYNNVTTTATTTVAIPISTLKIIQK